MAAQHHTFDFDLELADRSNSIIPSPEAATPISQQSPQKSSQRRWPTSTDGSKLDYSNKPSTSWEAPPVPPIPPDQPSEAWRRRSMKRDSYTSQMSLRLSESTTNLPATGVAMGESGSDETGVAGQGNASSSDEIAPVATQDGTRSRRASRPTVGMREKSQYEELHWQVSGANPTAWSRRRKWMHTLAAGGVAFAILFSSSIVAPARDAIEHSFSASRVVAVLSTALYILGLAFGSMLGNASAALVGRKVTQGSSLLLSVAFTIASACVDSFAALHACRFLAGLFASPALWISLAILLEMWAVEKLAAPMSTLVAMAVAGLALGPVAGSYIIESQNVRWTQYTIIIASSMALALVLAMRETHKETVQRAPKPAMTSIFKSAVVIPIAASVKSIEVALLAIHLGAVLGTFYAATTAFLTAFATTYDFALSGQGLIELSLLAGILIGGLMLVLNHRLLYQPRVARWRQQYDAEVERALAEDKLLKRRSRRNSRASSNRLQKRHSTLSFMQSAPKTESRTDLISTTIDFEDKNVALSAAAAAYLNSVNDKRILPERMLLILDKQPPFHGMCDQLESFGLRFDRAKLAQTFLDALQRTQQPSETRPTTAATAADSVHAQSRPTLRKTQSSGTLLTHPSPAFKAPPVWRLWPGLPASVVALAGLLLASWTLRPNIHWMSPVVGMGLYAAGGSVTLVSLALYLLEKHSEDAVAGGSFIVWVLAAVVPIFSVPMFSALGVDWAGSVLAFIATTCAVPVGVLVVKNRRR